MFYRRLASASILIAIAAPASAATLLPYALISLGNFVGLGGTTIGGALAVAGDARINSTAIGTRLTSDRDNSNVVVVGGAIAYDNSRLNHGSVIHGGANTSGKYTQAQTPGGSFSQGQALDFAAIGDGLRDLSTKYGAMATTGSFTTLNGAGTLSGTATPGTDVFALTTADLNSVYTLKLVGATGSTAVINVSGRRYASYFAFDSGNYAVADVIFNFVDARTLAPQGMNLAASLLAPLAALDMQGGRIGGSVAVGKFVGAGGEVGGEGGFSIGNSLAPVPEPASWAMMIAGFGLVGATQRRRRSVAA